VSLLSEVTLYRENPPLKAAWPPFTPPQRLFGFSRTSVGLCLHESLSVGFCEADFLRGFLAYKKRPSPQDRHRALGTGLR